MKAIGYVRVSTEEQANSGLSLDMQKTKIRAQAEALGFELIEVIEDAGRSGKDLHRPGAERLLEQVRARAVDAVIVLKLDRLTRSVRDLGFLLDLFTKSNVAFIAVVDAINTATASGRFMVNVLGSIAQWERETISERTVAALNVKRSRGEKLGGRVPYGYGVAGGKLIPDEIEQKGVRIIREMHREGYSFRQIGAELDLNGYIPRGGGPHWSAQSVKQVLKRIGGKQ